MKNLENKLGKNELKLSLVIEKDKPIDIQILSSSLMALNDLIDDYVAKDLGTDATSIKLKSVREGSDILDMIICLPFALFALSDFISSINSFFEFFKNIKSIAKKPVEDIKNNKFLTAQNLTKMQHLLDLADEKANARYNINYNNCNVFNLSASTKAEYQDGLNIVKQIKGHEEKKDKFFQNVLIKMQTVKDSQKIVKDKAYCDDVVMGRAIPTEITDIQAKKEILNDPFNNYFLVDLYADTIDGNVKLYRVTALYKIIPKDEE